MLRPLPPMVECTLEKAAASKLKKAAASNDGHNQRKSRLLGASAQDTSRHGSCLVRPSLLCPPPQPQASIGAHMPSPATP